jgi:hypothetical protein
VYVTHSSNKDLKVACLVLIVPVEMAFLLVEGSLSTFVVSAVTFALIGAAEMATLLVEGIYQLS